MRIEKLGVGIRTFADQDVIGFQQLVLESADYLSAIFPWCHSQYSVEESQDWVFSRQSAWDNGEEYSFLIYECESQKLLGSIALNQINKQHRIANLGYWVGQSALGKGIAGKASKLITRYGFDELALSRIEIVTLPKNLPSQRVAEKVGAKYEGVLQNRLVVEGVSVDACMYSLTNA